MPDQTQVERLNQLVASNNVLSHEKNQGYDLKFEKSYNLIGRESFWANISARISLNLGWVCNRKVKITRTSI